MDGRSEVTDQVVDIAFKCQLCGNCDVACKLCRYDMEPLAALRELRAHLTELDRVPESYRPIIERTRAALAGKGPEDPGRPQQVGRGPRPRRPGDGGLRRRLLRRLQVLRRGEPARDRAHAGPPAPARRPHRRPVRKRLLRRPRRQDGLPRRGRAGRQPHDGPVAGGRRQDRRHALRRLPPHVHPRLPGL